MTLSGMKLSVAETTQNTLRTSFSEFWAHFFLKIGLLLNTEFSFTFGFLVLLSNKGFTLWMKQLGLKLENCFLNFDYYKYFRRIHIYDIQVLATLVSLVSLGSPGAEGRNHRTSGGNPTPPYYPAWLRSLISDMAWSSFSSNIKISFWRKKWICEFF